MKRISLCAGFLLLLMGVSSAWSPYPTTLRLFQNIFGARIPQFILDTKHPWLARNKAWLSRYPNVAEELCSPGSSLWTTPGSTGHVLPADLLTNISIDSNKGLDGVSRGRVAWSKVRDRLREISACKASLTAARNLHVDVFTDYYGSSPTEGDTMPPPGLPELFADVLAQMSNLERLDWGISSEATREFERAFVAKGLMLPSVKHLKPGAGSDYLVSRCPNVEVLDVGRHDPHWSWYNGPSSSRTTHLLELIKASTGLKNLHEWHLWTSSQGWSTDLMEAILGATPNITGLRMGGNLEGMAAIRASTATAESRIAYLRRSRGHTLKTYLHLLAPFPNLENLQLPSSYDLDLGFDGGHWCGNAYDGPEGKAYGRSVTQQGAEATELAANTTLGILPHLKSLIIGFQHANLTINDGGQPDMTWPWTGRMEQYTYEIWQDYE